MKTRTSPTVLLKDFNDIWSPINEMYYILVSSQLYQEQNEILLISKHPKSSLHEVISVYCPQCFTRYSEEEAFIYVGCCPSCFQCPCCNSILIKHYDNEIMYCGMCLWKCTVSNLQYNKYKSSIEMKFSQLLEKFKNQPLQKDSYSHHNKLSFKEKSKIWQLEDLDLKLNTRLDNQSNIEIEPLDTTRLNDIFDDSIFGNDIDSNTADISQRSQCIHSNNLALSDLNPLPMRLRAKCTIRSRHIPSLTQQQQQQQRMNILIQPKMLPLEGDSSSKIQRGKWWVKDSSAIHEIPYIKIAKLPSIDELLRGMVGFIDIQLINLKETPITISFIAKYEINCESFHILDIMGNITQSNLHANHILKTMSEVTRKSSADTNGETEVKYEDAINSDKEALVLKLEGNEDELLKLDAIENSLPDSNMYRFGDDEKVNLLWNYTISCNKAILHIPIQLSNFNHVAHPSTLNIDSDSCFEIQLKCNIDTGNGTITMPIKIIF